MGKNSTSKNRIGMFIGGALVVLAIITWVSIDGFPPSFMDTTGTIGAAKKYQVEQINESDVVLEDQAIQALLQNDDFVRIVSDENFQALSKDAKLKELTQNVKINAVMMDALMKYRDAEFVRRAKFDFELAANKTQVLEDQIRSARLQSVVDQYLAAPEKWFEANKLAYRDMELAYRDMEFAKKMTVELNLAGKEAMVLDKLTSVRLQSVVDQYLAAPEKWFEANKLAYRDMELAYRDMEFAKKMTVELNLAGKEAMVLDKLTSARLQGVVDQYLAAPEKWFEANKLAYRDMELAYRDMEFAKKMTVELNLAGKEAMVLDKLTSARLQGVVDQYLAAPEKWFEANKLAYRDMELAYRDMEFAKKMTVELNLAGKEAMVLDKLTRRRLQGVVDQYLASPEKWFQENKLAHLADAEMLSRGVVDKISDASFVNRIRIESSDQ